jgi:hypothetical protein
MWPMIIAAASQARKLLELGQEYQGGVIAYFFEEGDLGYVAGEQHGIIAAKAEYMFSSQWGCHGLNTNIREARIGYATANTAAIITAHSGWQSPWYGEENGLISVCNIANNGDVSAKTCSLLNIGGYSDWIMPTRGELPKIKLIQTLGLYFWTGSRIDSSTERDLNRSWAFSFTEGFGDVSPTKSMVSNNIAIRYF